MKIRGTNGFKKNNEKYNNAYKNIYFTNYGKRYIFGI